MEDYVSAFSDGSLTGPARWYTWLHLLHCRKCSAALRGLRALRDRLRALSHAERPNEPPRTLTAERRVAMETAMNAVDQRRAEGQGDSAD
jgi:hypothetical protein